MEQMTLFDREIPQPLAARLRPETLEEYVGQTHLLGPGKVLRRLIESDRISSMIFWGPPGVGENHSGENHRPPDQIQLHRLLRCDQRDQGNQSRHAGGGEQPPVRNPHHRVCGRDPSLQQSAAGRLSSLCGEGQHHFNRGHHGESLLRDQRSASVRCKVFVLKELTVEGPAFPAAPGTDGSPRLRVPED